MGDRVARPLGAAALLLVVYVGLSLLNDPGGYLGSDTGAKVATLEVMDRTGSAEPDLGYWAAAYDPTGRVHPIWGTNRTDAGWVHVTTLPMLELGRPLYALGGYRLTLLIPMLGGIGAAFAARSIARRSAGSEQAGWLAYWVVGLASPIAIYALDFWEHAPGVACMVGAVALLAGVLDGEARLARSLGAGALLGLAATMRTEAFVYALVAVGLVQLLLVVDGRRWRAAFEVGVAAVAGFAGPWCANLLLESALGGTDRGSRVGGAASAGLGGFSDRLREGAVTLFALRSADFAEMLLLGGLFAALVVGAVLASRRGPARWVPALLLVAAGLQLAAIVDELGFVPGLFSAAPIALLALVVKPRSLVAAYPLLVAVAALPLVWAFQFLGGALPQWGGRYALSSCVLLVALGAGASLAEDRLLRLGLLGLSVLVTVSGVLWLGHRSRAVDDFFEVLVDQPEDVVIVHSAFLVREGGPAYAERRWLTADTDADVVRAARVVDDAGLTSFVVVARTPDVDRLPNARAERTDVIRLLGDPIYLHRYEVTNMRSQSVEAG